MFTGNLHPLIVHFPIALLYLYPLIVLGMIFWKREKRALDILGFVLLILALISMIAATETGEALEFPIKRISADIYRALEQHEQLGEAAMGLLYGTFIIHAMYVLSHSAWGQSFFSRKENFKGSIKKSFASFLKKVNKWKKWILRILLLCSLSLVVLISLVGSAGGKLAHYYRVGALACLEIAHPLDEIVQSVLPMEEKLNTWKKKYAPESKLSSKELFETLCKPLAKQ